MSLVRSASRFAVLGALAASACLNDSRMPFAPAARPAPRLSAMTVSTAATGGAGTGRHIVSFSGAVPADFGARVTALRGTVLWVSPGSGLAAVGGLTGSAPAMLAAAKGIQAVDADAAIALEMPQAVPADAADVTGGLASNADPAAARFFALQWNMRAVQADVAWAHGALGSSNVSVFMLDSGIDYLHLDLLGRVDLTRSVDLLGTFLAQAVVNGDTVIVPFTEADTVAKYFAGRQPFTDLFFHGTHTAATVSSNAVAAAGITSGTTLVAVKVCGYIDVCPFSSILNGVIYAAQHGADVINLSLGAAFPKAGNGRFVGLLQKVFNFASRKGVTIVVSAGNDAANLNLRELLRGEVTFPSPFSCEASRVGWSLHRPRCLRLLLQLRIRYRCRRARREQLVRSPARTPRDARRVRVGRVQPDQPADQLRALAHVYRWRAGHQHGGPACHRHRRAAGLDTREAPRPDQDPHRADGRPYRHERPEPLLRPRPCECGAGGGCDPLKP